MIKSLILFRKESVLIFVLAVFHFILKVGQLNAIILDDTKMCQQKGLWISASVKGLVLVLCACA